LIHRYARGIPRLINVICDNCLFEAYLVRKEHIDASVVEGVVADLGLKSGALPPAPAPAAARAPAAPPAGSQAPQLAPDPVAPATAAARVAPPRDPTMRSVDALLNREEIESLGLLREI